MRVWLVNAAEPVPSDGADRRILRTGLIARRLLADGHLVTRFASSFDHVSKTQRVDHDTLLQVEPGYDVQLMHAPKYLRHASARRFLNHRALGRAFERLAATHPRPDLIMASFPPIELAGAAARFARDVDVPAIVDVRDMWPDVAEFSAPGWSKLLVRLAVKPLERQANRACAEAFALSAHTPQFLSWALQRAGRAAATLDRSFPFGYEAPPVTAEGRAEAEVYWNEAGVTGGLEQLVVSYVGAISRQMEADALFTAAELLRDVPAIRFVVCGIGDQLAEVERRAAGKPNVSVVGWIEQPALQELIRRSSVGLVPLRSSTDYLSSIPNKIPEYLAGGLPVAISFSSGAAFELLAANDCGFSYGNSGAELAGHLTTMLDDPALLTRQRASALAVYGQEFRAADVYARLVRHLETVEAAYRART